VFQLKSSGNATRNQILHSANELVDVAEVSTNSTVPIAWDEWLSHLTCEASFCQTSAWAKLSVSLNGADPYFFEVLRNGKRVAGALLSLRRPNVRHMSITQRAKAILSGDNAGWLSCFQGPVLSGPDKTGALAEILVQVDALAAHIGARGIRFHGPPPVSDWTDDEAVLNVFRDYNYVYSPFFTALVDLDPSEDEVFGRFKHAARKGIRKCKRSGVQIAQCQTREAFIQDFCVPYYDDADDLPDQSRNLAIWDVGSQHYRFFVAKDAQGRVLATLGTYNFNGLATEIMSHRTKASFEENLPAQDLLHWHIFKVHKAAGDRWFNLAGYSPDPATPKEAGIRRFKEKWGGRKASVPVFTKEFPSLSRRTWRALTSRRPTAISPLDE
jgi:hypothetical protein